MASYEPQDKIGYWMGVALVVLWVAAFVSCLSRPSRPGPTRPLGDFDGFQPPGPSRFTD
jgi:hypothetical protein